MSPSSAGCVSPVHGEGHLLVSDGLFTQLLVQLPLQVLQLGPRLGQLLLEPRYFLGMFPVLNPGVKTKGDEVGVPPN